MSIAKSEIPDHPARFSRAVLSELRSMLTCEVERVGRVRVIDPFAGVGLVHELADERVETIGVEIQPEWAAAHPDTTCANVLDFARSWEREAFDVLLTSPAYGNRMADSHDARDECRTCAGDGYYLDQRPPDFARITCEACKGSGLTMRNTYTHALQRSGAKPVEHDDNAVVMQWGARYREFHDAVWASCSSYLLRPGGLVLLNVKNHVRRSEVQRVVEFHVNSWLRLRYTIEEARPIETRGLAYGANHDVRTPHELIIALRKSS